MKGNRVILALVCALGLFLCMSTGAWAYGNNLPYYDNFNDGNASGWTVVSGDWFIQDGEYVQENIGRNDGETPYGWDQMTALAGIPQSDYTVQARMRLLEADYSGWWGLLFRYQDSSNYYTILLYTTPTYTRLEFWTYLDNSWRLVQSEYVDVDPYDWNTLRADVAGNVFDFYLNGQFIFQSTDDTLAYGDVGLYTEDTRAAFDDWRMYGSVTAIEDLIAEVGNMLASGDITNEGITTSLTSTLDSALRAQQQGNIHAAKNTLVAFMNKVRAQSGKHISEEAAARIIEAATQLLAAL